MQKNFDQGFSRRMTDKELQAGKAKYSTRSAFVKVAEAIDQRYEKHCSHAKRYSHRPEVCISSRSTS